MKTLLSVLLGIFALATASFGQIVINSTDYPEIGSSTAYGGLNTTTTFDCGSPGENQTWTFGSYEWTDVTVYEVVAPASAPHGVSFPTATHAVHVFHPDQDYCYRYERVTPTAHFELGWGMVGDSAITFVEPSTEMPFPCTYQSAWTTVRTTTYIMEGMNFVECDSAVSTVDGWGTITTPYGSYPALRVFIHRWMTFTVDGEVMQSMSALFYAWKDQEGNSVCHVQSLTDDDPNFTTGFLTMMGVPLSVEPGCGPVARQFELGQNYPNPFNPSTTLPVELSHNAHVSVAIYDESGRQVSFEEYDLPGGLNLLRVDGSHWATGAYFARASAAGQSQTKKMMLLK